MRETLRWGRPRRCPTSVCEAGTTYGKTGVVAPLAFRVLLYPDGGQEARLAG
ncbi:MAG TPA: hypothetical protein VKA51_04065 [Rubrobacteraceae bacterium]|nr:hypothetical protein [Rubrobacteraceae bacterium]